MPIIGNTKGRPTSRIQFNLILKKFIVFLKQQLNINYDIPIILVDDVNFSKQIRAFGEISDKNIIYISIMNRHPMDILRTVAHEFVHYNQYIKKRIHHRTSSAGSPEENRANAKAGELMRKYGNLHPDLFDLMPIR